VTRDRTQVAVIGAGPAGLTLGQLLHRAGIDAVILENRSRDHVEARIRAGVLEQGTVELLERAGVADRLHREGIVHHGIYLQFDGERHHVPLSDLTGGRSIVIYGQTEVVKDLIAARLEARLPLHFDTSNVAVDGFDDDEPYVTYEHDGREHRLDCDVIAGCDGFHGVCRPAIERELQTYSREYPFGWLGILAEVAPSSDELVYTHHTRGFALLSLRSPTRSRLYIQCRPDEDVEEWPDDRIWEELHARTALDGWSLEEGPVLEKGVTGMRSFVAEPMQRGRLFLAGDAAHIVPPTGAKGLNLAVSDVYYLSRALAEYYRSGSHAALDGYTKTALRRVWASVRISWYLTMLLHRFPDASEFDQRAQEYELEYIRSSPHAQAALAEQYAGLPL